MWYKNIAGRFFGLVTKHACDGRTDGRTELRLPWRTSIARAVKSLCHAAISTQHNIDDCLHFAEYEPHPWFTRKLFDKAERGDDYWRDAMKLRVLLLGVTLMLLYGYEVHVHDYRQHCAQRHWWGEIMHGGGTFGPLLRVKFHPIGARIRV